MRYKRGYKTNSISRLRLDANSDAPSHNAVPQCPTLLTVTGLTELRLSVAKREGVSCLSRRAVWARYNVHEFLRSEADWSWVLLMLAEEGLPITKVPRSPQRLGSTVVGVLRLGPRAASVPRRRSRADATCVQPGIDRGTVWTAPGSGRRRGFPDRGGARGDDRLRRRDPDRT
jgi:hypothetical protein